MQSTLSLVYFMVNGATDEMLWPLKICAEVLIEAIFLLPEEAVSLHVQLSNDLASKSSVAHSQGFFFLLDCDTIGFILMEGNKEKALQALLKQIIFFKLKMVFSYIRKSTKCAQRPFLTCSTAQKIFFFFPAGNLLFTLWQILVWKLRVVIYNYQTG